MEWLALWEAGSGPRLMALHGHRFGPNQRAAETEYLAQQLGGLVPDTGMWAAPARARSTFDPTAAGALSGGSFTVISNFDNVAPVTVGVTSTAYDTKCANAAPISPGLSSWMKWIPGTVTSCWFFQVRQKARDRPISIEPGSAEMNSFGSSVLASQAP